MTTKSGCLVIVGACENHQTIVDQQPVITFSEEMTDECQETISERLNLNNSVAASISFQYNREEYTIHRETIHMRVSLYENIRVTTESIIYSNSLLHFTINQAVEDFMDNTTTKVNHIEIAPFRDLYEIELVDQRTDEEAISLGVIPESIWLRFKLTETEGICAGEEIFIEVNGTKVSI